MNTANDNKIKEQPPSSATAGSAAAPPANYDGMLEKMHAISLNAKAHLTVELESWIIRAINQHGFEEGLSVHQVLGAMKEVEHQVLNKWQESKTSKPPNS